MFPIGCCTLNLLHSYYAYRDQIKDHTYNNQNMQTEVSTAGTKSELVIVRKKMGSSCLERVSSLRHSVTKNVTPVLISLISKHNVLT